MEERRPDRSVIAGLDAGSYLEQRLNVVFQCVCSIESGPCERVESLQMSGRF